jgi:hypothetical protein
MNGIILSFFLSIILIIRLLPLNSTTNLIFNIIAGVLFFLLGISEVSSKGWKAYLISLIGALLVIFSFFPKLRSGSNYIFSTLILCILVIIFSLYIETGLIKFKKEKK